MKILFRVDSSVQIGTGHVMRCLVLAQELKRIGHDIHFAMRPLTGNLYDLITSKGIELHKLPKTDDTKKTFIVDDYDTWLPVTQLEDAQDVCSRVEAVDLLIVDHYGINQTWEAHIKQTLQCKILVIDDLLRHHECDFLLDQTLERKVSDYQNKTNTDCEILTGTQYALLNPLFSHYRSKILNQKESPNKKHSILISMGGIDNHNITLSILEELKKYGFNHFSTITVIMSPKSPYYNNVKNFQACNKEITQIDFVDNMAELMTYHTIAIGAPGSTSWERACLGIPSIIVPLAENQKMVCSQLAKAKVAIEVNIKNISTELTDSINKLIDDFDTYKKNALSLCDGKGIYRVISKIVLGMNNNKIFKGCRLATNDDIEQVYIWQCLPETRRFSLNKNTPSHEEHIQWMEKKLACINSYFYIIEINNEKLNTISAGVVRLDKIENNEYLISIFIDPKHFGKKIAQQALNYIDLVHPDITINATVLIENIASQKLFTSANYEKLNEESFRRLPLRSK